MNNVRHSNLELYRIIVMLFIVAHHYVVYSGMVEVMAVLAVLCVVCSLIDWIRIRLFERRMILCAEKIADRITTKVNVYVTR